MNRLINLMLFSKSLVILPIINDLGFWLTGRIDNTFTPSTPLGVKITNGADSSGLGKDVSQANSALQPELDTINNFLAMETFRASDRALFRTDALGLTGNPALTIFVVIKYNVLDGGSGFFFNLGAKTTPGSNRNIRLQRISPTNKFRIDFNGESITFSAVATLTTQLISITFPGGASDHDATKLWRNGVAATRETSSSAVSILVDEQFVIGGFAGDFAFGSDDQTIAEVILYNKALSDLDRVLVENDLIAVYNIS